MSTIIFVASMALAIFRDVLVFRFIIDWIRTINPNFRPRKFLLVLAEIGYLLTDWAVKPLARLIKPVRVGGGYLDLSPLALFLGIWLLQGLLNTLS